jgi:intracellular sulfur oxidation DsrE/DsrF family protein
MRRALSLIAAVALTASVAAEEKLGPPVEFTNIPEIPIPAGVDFEGFFTKDRPVKIVFGIADPGHQMRESLTNAAYSIMYLKPRGIPYEMEVVIYARATNAASQFNEEYAGFLPLMEDLHREGVEFRVCNNSMGSLKLDADDLHPFMKVIPAGILEIARKQMQGFHYISNPDGH